MSSPLPSVEPVETSERLHVVNDFSIQVATVNGSGSQTANLVLLRSIFQMGVPVSGKNLFPSNIAGLPTWYTIRANHRGYVSRKKEIDFLVAMNPETAREDKTDLDVRMTVTRRRYTGRKPHLNLHQVWRMEPHPALRRSARSPSAGSAIPASPKTGPGAFNLTTGPLHFELLQRARAVDNQLFVAAVSPARDLTATYHAWGHSSIVDPWCFSHLIRLLPSPTPPPLLFPLQGQGAGRGAGRADDHLRRR